MDHASASHEPTQNDDDDRPASSQPAKNFGERVQSDRYGGELDGANVLAIRGNTACNLENAPGCGSDDRRDTQHDRQAPDAEIAAERAFDHERRDDDGDSG